MQKNSLLFYKSLLPFLTFVNCESAYLADGFLQTLAHILIFICTIRSHGKIKVCWNSDCCRAFFLYKKGIIEVVNPNIPSRKISLRKNVNRKGKTFFVPNLQYCPFKQGGWENRNKLKISWKFSHWKNLLIFYTQERALRQIFSCS